MSATFLDRNKKKSLLAALLLFLRERKILVLLLLLVLLVSTVFLGPSALFRMNFLAKWLGSGDKHSYSDLLAAFKAAKNKSAAGGAGWGGFFGQGGGSGNGNGSGNGAAGAGSGAPSSLDFVKGSKADLGQEPGAGAGGAGAAGAGAQTVAGIANSANPKDGQVGDAVAVGDGDVGAEGAGLVANAFAGGFMNGLGASGYTGDGALSGGAFASKGFFSGNGGAAGTANGMAQNGLAGVASPSTPSSVKSGVGKSSLSAMNARRAVTGSQNGFSGFSLGGKNSPYSQLAVGAANTYMFGNSCSGTSCCAPPDCPPEFAATNTGAIYDGSDTTAGILTAGGGGSSGNNSGGLLNSSVSVPPAGSGGFGGDSGGGAAADAQNMQTCAALVQTCAGTFTAPMEQEGKDENQLQAWFVQMPGACGNPCSCGPCRTLNSEITGLCNGDFTTQTNLLDTPCAPLPDFCTPLGFTNPDPPANQTINCTQNMGSCGCHSFFCSLGCLLGS